MKSFSILLLGALLSTTVIAQLPVNEPQASFETEVFDFGEIAKGSDGQCAFTLTNSGDDALVITKCDKTCGCTIPKCNPAPIGPGETSDVVVTYDTKRVGPFNKSVKVHTNDPERPIIVLRVRGTVLG